MVENPHFSSWKNPHFSSWKNGGKSPLFQLEKWWGILPLVTPAFSVTADGNWVVKSKLG